MNKEVDDRDKFSEVSKEDLVILVKQLTEEKKHLSNNLRDFVRFQNQTSNQETIF